MSEVPDVFDRIAGRATAGPTPTARLTARRAPRFTAVAAPAAGGPRGDDGGEAFSGTAPGRAPSAADKRHRGAQGIERYHDDRPDGDRPERGGPRQEDSSVTPGEADVQDPEPQHVEPGQREGARATLRGAGAGAGAGSGSTGPVPALGPPEPPVEVSRTYPDLEHESPPAGPTAERDLDVPPPDSPRRPGRTPVAPEPPPFPPVRADRSEVEAPLRPGPLRGRRRRRPDPGPAPESEGRVVSSDDLLRDHVAPALVAQDALSVRAAERLTARGLDPVDVPAGGDVHIHIGTVELRQPEAPAPPAPARPERTPDRVDHADYLARQQRRWS